MGYCQRYLGRNIEPTGQVDRVTAYETNSGEMWVSWGELRLDLYDSSGTLSDRGTVMMD